MVENEKWYFKNENILAKILRALNLLEPDRAVISMTKVLLWGTTIQSILVIHSSQDGLQMITALGLNVAAMVKHESRRFAGNSKDDDKDGSS